MHALHFSLVINIFSVVYIACTIMQWRDFYDIIFENNCEEFKLSRVLTNLATCQ